MTTVSTQGSNATVIATGTIPRLLQEGVNKVFGNGLKEWDPKYSKIYMVDKSTKDYEVDVQVDGFGLAAVKDQGDDITFDSSSQGFVPKYYHVTYGKGFIITEEAIEDELYGQFTQGAKRLAKAMNISREYYAHQPLNNAWDTNYTMLGGDGKPLFSTTHPNGPAGGTFSNRLTVEADLSEASLEDLTGLVLTATDARGLPAMITIKRLVISAGVNAFNTQRIMGSVLQNDTGNNATNAMKDLGLITEGWMQTPYLTQQRAWFLTTNAEDGLRYFQRREITFGQDNSFTTGNARFKSTMRQSQGWSDARGAYGGSSGV
jgi:hypothetical protein